MFLNIKNKHSMKMCVSINLLFASFDSQGHCFILLPITPVTLDFLVPDCLWSFISYPFGRTYPPGKWSPPLCRWTPGEKCKQVPGPFAQGGTGYT